MTRSSAREIAVHLSFELGFCELTAEELFNQVVTPEYFALLGEEEPLYREFPDEKQLEYIRKLVVGVNVHAPEINAYIEKYAVGWSFSRISRVAAAIMSIAMYEILYMPDIPDSAAINEALEIAKGYEDQKGVAFINGILGSFTRQEFPNTPVTVPTPAVAEPTETVAEEVAPVQDGE